MRLVLKYGVGDGCTYGCTVTVPIEYDSLEAAIVDFEELCKGKTEEFSFAGQSFDPYDFHEEGIYYDPSILTLDEWYSL